MGIRDRPISPRSPWQNGYSERLIGSIRRDCLDHVVVLGERHLRHLLANYATYYNGVRTHLDRAAFCTPEHDRTRAMLPVSRRRGSALLCWAATSRSYRTISCVTSWPSSSGVFATRR